MFHKIKKAQNSFTRKYKNNKLLLNFNDVKSLFVFYNYRCCHLNEIALVYLIRF